MIYFAVTTLFHEVSTGTSTLTDEELSVSPDHAFHPATLDAVEKALRLCPRLEAHRTALIWATDVELIGHRAYLAAPKVPDGELLYAFNLADWDGTKALDARVEATLEEHELSGGAIIRWSREDAKNIRIGFGHEDLNGLLQVVRTRDVAEFPAVKPEHDAPSVLRKRSTFLLDLACAPEITDVLAQIKATEIGFNGIPSFDTSHMHHLQQAYLKRYDFLSQQVKELIQAEIVKREESDALIPLSASYRLHRAADSVVTETVI